MYDNCRFRKQNLSDPTSTSHNKLREAVRSKNIKLVQDLIKIGAPVNRHYSLYDHTPLHLAVISRCPEIVKALLDGGANTSIRSWNEETPLTLASRMHNTTIVDLLLSYDVQNCKAADHLSHLHVSCMRDNISVVRKLLMAHQGQNVNQAIRHDSAFCAGYTPLHCAVENGCIETVKFLLECGADITAQDSRQLTPLHLANLSRNEEIIDLILAVHKFELKNPTDPHGLSHFHIACTRDNASIVEHFLKSGVNADLQCELFHHKGWKPIHFAIYYECLDVIPLLLANGISLKDRLFRSLLEHSFEGGNKALYDVLLDNRAQFPRDFRNKINPELSSFHHACISNNSDEIQGIWSNDNENALQYLNTPIWTGSTILHLAARYRSDDVTKILLGCGADIMKQDAEGKSPLHVAFNCFNQTIVELMVDTFIENTENVTDDVGLSFFHMSCTTNKLKVVLDFLSRGVDLNSKVTSRSARWAGFTPLHFAVRFLQPEMVKLLLEHGADILIRNDSKLKPSDLLVSDFSFTYYASPKASKILMDIALSSPEKVSKLEYQGISILHSLCVGDALYGDAEEKFKQFIETLSSDEINKSIEVPQSPFYNNKCTPLHLALKNQNDTMVNILLDHGADPLLQNNAGETPLEFSASFSPRWDEVGDFLKSVIPSAELVQSCKPSHFHIACVLNVLTFVQHFLNNVTDENLKMKFLNWPNDAGRTSLHSILLDNHAEYYDGVEIIQLLVENGADVSAKDCELQTPLHFAGEDTDVDVVRNLILYGADVNAQNLYGQTPLHTIFTYDQGSFENAGDIEICSNRVNPKRISLLLEAGADINIVDELNQTCLMIKGRCAWDSPRFRECITVLLKHVRKLRIIGSHISDLNKRAYAKLSSELRNSGGSFSVASFSGECQKELELMMSIFIDRYTTLHDILLKSAHEMSFYSENVNLQNMFESEDVLGTYPIYGFLLRLQLKRGKVRRPLLNSSEKTFTSLIKKTLPRECLEKILGYLDDTDLQNIIAIETMDK